MQVTFQGRRVEIEISCGDDPVDAVVESAYYMESGDQEPQDLTDSEIEALGYECAGEIQEAARIDQIERAMDLADWNQDR